jgi:2-C-methyl-D-erythritol 4-phosphate cytidylyltransferase
VETVKRGSPKGEIEATLPRENLWLAQTPQAFRKDWIVEAHAKRARGGRDVTDDAQLVEELGHSVQLVEGSASNIKITTHADLLLAEAILKGRPKPRPAGSYHPFAEEAKW